MNIYTINGFPCAICEFDADADVDPIEWLVDAVAYASEAGWIEYDAIMRAEGYRGSLEALRNIIVDMRKAPVDHANVEANYSRIRASLRLPMDYVRIIGNDFDDTILCEPLRGRAAPWGTNHTRLVSIS